MKQKDFTVTNFYENYQRMAVNFGCLTCNDERLQEIAAEFVTGWSLSLNFRKETELDCK